MVPMFSFLFVLLTSCAGNAQNATDVIEQPKPPVAATTITPLEIGSAAPLADHKMLDVSGAEVSVNDSKLENGTLVLFSCNTCPYVIGWEDRYPIIAEFCKENNIGLLVVNSNEAQRDGVDSYKAMRQHAIDNGYQFSYVVDKNHDLADAFGATRTPELFLFDKDLKLVYKGCIDDNMKEPESVQQFYIKNAAVKMVGGEVIDPNVTKSVGCSIKRISKI